MGFLLIQYMTHEIMHDRIYYKIHDKRVLLSRTLGIELAISVCMHEHTKRRIT